MATAKSSSFWLTETIELPAASASGTRVQGTISLEAYVSVIDSLGIAIDSVDGIIQGDANNYGDAVGDMLQGNGALSWQLTDLNPGTAFIRADGQSLIASGAMNVDQSNNVATHTNDLYPDNYGNSGSLAESFITVNPTLYIVGGVQSAATSAADSVFITVRVRCRAAKLSKSDYVALAIESTANQ